MGSLPAGAHKTRYGLVFREQSTTAVLKAPMNYRDISKPVRLLLAKSCVYALSLYSAFRRRRFPDKIRLLVTLLY